MPIEDAALDRLEQELGHQFEDRKLLCLALVHRSYTSEADLGDSYERLEFLGDAVLQLAITNHLYVEFPELAEGEMAKVRAAVVNERALARVARSLNLGPLVLLGRGEELTGGREKDSILSDVVESVLGALYLEAGFAVAQEMILNHWGPLIGERAVDPGCRDYKTRLQEHLAQRGMHPIYEVDEAGPEHAKQFIARVCVDEKVLGEGVGTSKKRAQQEAAERAAELLAIDRSREDSA